MIKLGFRRVPVEAWSFIQGYGGKASLKYSIAVLRDPFPNMVNFLLDFFRQ